MQVLMRTLARLGADLWDTDAPMATTNPGPYILQVLGQDMLGSIAVCSNFLHERLLCLTVRRYWLS